MRRQPIIAFAICFAFLLAACQPDSAPALPTLAEVAPPTTEVPSTAAPPTEAPATATPFVRATLPPIFTPTASPTHTPLPPTATLTAQPIVSELLEVCRTFNINRETSQTEFLFGTTPRVEWFAVEGAAFYRVSLKDRFGLEIFNDFTEDTSFIFPIELFDKGALYGWEVYPLDAAGIQMCYGLGSELFPRDR